MRIESHKTPTSSLLECLDGWRNSQNWSRETLAQVIVETHEASDGPRKLRVRFESGITDVFKRAHTNATRIFRWFNDDEKDTNLLSVNFLPSVLLALPYALRITWLNTFLRPLGLGVHGLNEATGALDAQSALCNLLKEDAESHQAIACLIADQSPAALAAAHRELTDSIEAATKIRKAIEAALPQAGK